MKHSIFGIEQMGTFNGVEPKQWDNFGEASKILNLPKIGRNKLLAICRDLQILSEVNWYMDPYWDMPEHFMMNPINGVNMPLISSKGIKFLQEKFPVYFI